MFSKRVVYAGAFSLFAAALAACGGGGGGGSTPPTSGGGTNPSPTSSPTTTPTANASGTVVDYTSNTPLSGVPIAIASWAPGALPSPVATTDSSGKFSFTTAPGTYMLVVGSDSPTDTRSTLHENVALSSGSNTLKSATPQPEPDVTPLPSQGAGALRLMTLTSTQQDCVSGANKGRANLSLPLLVPDEYLEEDAIADTAEELAQNTDTPSPLFGYAQPNGSVSGMTTEANFNPCDTWTGPGYSYVSGSPPYASATSATNIWYGASIVSTQSGGTLGSQLWSNDPR